MAGAPAALAQDVAPVDTSSPIGAYWEQNKDVLGAPKGAEQTFANGSKQQVFESGVVTSGKWGGAQAITGKAAETFLKAGGAEKFGNAESAPWKHGYCGLSLTTHDSKTRWLVVLDEKTQAGSYIDLRSAEGKKWQAERSKTRSCFANNAQLEDIAPVEEQPVTPVLRDGTTPGEQTPAHITAAANKIADARAIAVANGISVAEQGQAPREVTEDLVAQDFGNNVSGLYSKAQDRALLVNTNALKVYLTKPAAYGSYLYMNEFVENRATGATELRALFYNTAATQCSTPETWDDHGYALYATADGKAVMSQYYVQFDDFGTCINYESQVTASPVSWAEGMLDRTPQGTEIDATYDWASAKFIPLQQVLELRLDANKVVYIKADEAGKPLAGAKPVESSALTQALNLADRGRFSSYNDWATGGNWNIWSEMTMLGAPVAAATESTANGTTIVTQAFEGGTLVWTKGTPYMNAELNELGQAKLAWYKGLGI